LGAGIWAPARWKPELLAGLSRGKYVTVMVLLLCMLGLPVKMVLRLVFNVKYILATPWFNI
jgi:hypothetical protein